MLELNLLVLLIVSLSKHGWKLTLSIDHIFTWIIVFTHKVLIGCHRFCLINKTGYILKGKIFVCHLEIRFSVEKTVVYLLTKYDLRFINNVQ